MSHLPAEFVERHLLFERIVAIPPVPGPAGLSRPARAGPRGRLDGATLAEATLAGRALTVDEAVALALDSSG